MFDVNQPIALKMRRGKDIITVRMRFPNDAEWTERQRRRKVIVKQLGRGQSETTIPESEAVDAALLAKIRTDEGAPEVDAYEAQKLVEELSYAEVEDVKLEGDLYVVTVRVLGSTVKHFLRIPSAKDVTEYRRGFARVVDLPFGKQQLTLNLAPAAELYGRLVDRVEGYVGDVVPIVHQTVAVKGAIDALDAAFQEDQDSNF